MQGHIMEGRTPYYDLKRQIVFDLLDKFPDASTNMLAKIVHRDNPGFFKDREAARCYIRGYKGALGDKQRETYKVRKYFTEDALIKTHSNEI